ncbi:Transglutaminase-like protein [Synechococcus sp. BIOS-E4-1]|uniref:transglutaminase family protein n=1 Tax=Synechococcus sp. BIOS-E4-1 TaxID=1400864 RepID=UPI0016442FE7|nr:transglutaminase domain-containing protein [Synechococcus sp. BIOS-E4-1]QNI54242.1 Transglutaminase-like protein [Synechococcus sp. BIOS-E4-1]
MIRRPSKGVLAWCAFPPLLLQCFALNSAAALTWSTWALVICAMFKLRESRRPFDWRLVALLQLLSAGLLAAQLQSLLASTLQLIAVCTALAALLSHELQGMLSFRGLLQRSLQLLAAALPLALVLFLLVPRLPPLWTTQFGPAHGAVTGLSPDLDPLSIATLASDEASAARLTVAQGVVLPVDAYWRVLVHETFDGRRWQHRDSPAPKKSLSNGRSTATISQWWVVEPSATRALPWDGRSAPVAADQWITPEGELLMDVAPRQRRAYRLQAAGNAQEWQRRPPLASERQLPRDGLPRLRQLGESFRSLPSDRERLAAVEQWFRTQPFQYSLQPGSVLDLDEFLFDRQLGFCGHYASALAALLRSADVPARVVSGYRGGQLVNPLGGADYLELRQSDAHAWVDVWLNDSGWQRVDPTLWIASTAQNPLSQQLQSPLRSASELPWWKWIQRQWWGLDLVWTRWWLGFDQSSQQMWLQRLFGHQQRWLGLTVLLTSMAASGLGWVMLRQSVAGRHPLDQSLRLLARFGVVPLPGESFAALCKRASHLHPDQADLLAAMADRQQLIAYAQLSGSRRRDLLRQWRIIRRRLRSCL